jgi:serine/threonine protein kinase
MSDPLLGKIISERYKLTEVLGQGGMGIVFKAEDLRLNNRLCAVKLLKGQTTDPHEAKRFEAELQIISRLRSPHVVQVLDTGYFEGHRLYIVMELLEGEPLSNLSSREGALALPRAIQITKGILAGLSEAHEYGIVHRDLKPANIFITRSRAGDEITKVLDFGIAKDINSDESSGLTSASMIIGTPKYMAPEQFMKQPTDVRTDIYAVGLLLYQLVAGDPPFMPTNDQLPATLAMMPAEFKVGWLHLNAEPRPLNLPSGLWPLIASMIAKDPNARPASVTLIIDQLNQILSQMSMQTGVFTSLHTPSGDAYADASGQLSTSGPRAVTHSGPRVAPSLAAPSQLIQAPQYAAPQEATTGIPFVGQLPPPAPPRGASLRLPMIAAGVACVVGVAAWQGGGGGRSASSDVRVCDLTIAVSEPARGARITLTDPKNPKRSMSLQSGRAFQGRCDVLFEAHIEADGYAPHVLKEIDMREGRSPYHFSVSLVSEGAGLAPKAPDTPTPKGSVTPTPKGSLAPTPKGSDAPQGTPRAPQRAPKGTPVKVKGEQGGATPPKSVTPPDAKGKGAPKAPVEASPARRAPEVRPEGAGTTKSQSLTKPEQRAGKGLNF